MSTTKDRKIILKCIGCGIKKASKEIVGLGKRAPSFKSSMLFKNVHLRTSGRSFEKKEALNGKDFSAPNLKRGPEPYSVQGETLL